MIKKILIYVFALFFSLILVLGQMNSSSATKTIVQRQALAWETKDVLGIIEDFAPNGVFKVGNYVFEGKAEIQKAAEDYFQQFTDTKVTIKRIIIQEHQGAVEWDWSDRNIKTGQVSYAEDAIIFELQSDGKIIYWREYIEKKS